MAVATVTSKGQVTIPASIRRKFGIESGTRLDWQDTPSGHIAVTIRKTSLNDLFGSVPHHGVHLSAEEMRRVA